MDLTREGSEFQAKGPATENALRQDKRNAIWVHGNGRKQLDVYYVRATVDD